MGGAQRNTRSPCALSGIVPKRASEVAPTWTLLSSAAQASDGLPLLGAALLAFAAMLSAPCAGATALFPVHRFVPTIQSGQVTRLAQASPCV